MLKQISVFTCGDEIWVQDFFSPPLIDLVNAWSVMKAPLLIALKKGIKKIVWRMNKYMKISLAFRSILNVSKHINMRAFKTDIFLWEMKIIKKSPIYYVFFPHSLSSATEQ